MFRLSSSHGRTRTRIWPWPHLSVHLFKWTLDRPNSRKAADLTKSCMPSNEISIRGLKGLDIHIKFASCQGHPWNHSKIKKLQGTARQTRGPCNVIFPGSRLRIRFTLPSRKRGRWLRYIHKKLISKLGSYSYLMLLPTVFLHLRSPSRSCFG